MKIQSNTIGKLSKIKDGNVFSDEFTYLKEFVQNTQRSNATACVVEVDAEKLIFTDNGCGCKNPQSLLTLDLSDWKSTTEGFGIGFWSCLSIEGLTKVIVESHDWKAVIDVDKIFSTGDLDVDVTQNEFVHGFTVTLMSNTFFNEQDNIRKYLEENTKFIEEIMFQFMGDTLEKKSLTSLIPNNVEFSEEVDSPYFTGALYPSKCYYEGIHVFYEKREVKTLGYPFRFVGGIIEIKHGKLNLKEPDRNEIVKNKKYDMFVNKLKRCVTDMYKNFIIFKGESIFSEMDEAITNWLTTKDYEKYLKLDSLLDSDLERNKESEDEDKAESLVLAKLNAITINPEIFNFPDEAKENIAMKPSAKELTGGLVEYNQFSKYSKKIKKFFWVSKSETLEYEDSIARARYCGLTVIVAPNKLYEAVFIERGVLHISTIGEHLFETFIKKNIEIKNDKEENFLILLEPIRKKYGLRDNSILICDLEKNTELRMDDKIAWKDSVVNKKNKIRIYGCCDGCNIYLDRKALMLNRWNIGRAFRTNELKAIMNCIETIAHELAHYLYHTEDNTLEHYKKQTELQSQIISLYV